MSDSLRDAVQRKLTQAEVWGGNTGQAVSIVLRDILHDARVPVEYSHMDALFAARSAGYEEGVGDTNARWQKAIEAALRNHEGPESYDEGWRDALDLVQVRALGEESHGE